eukprot:365543-Chlamydomonas_euryale.AAC.5
MALDDPPQLQKKAHTRSLRTHVYPAAGVHDGACVLAKRMEHAARRQPAALVVRELHVCQLDGRGMAAGGPAKGVGEPRLQAQKQIHK